MLAHESGNMNDSNNAIFHGSDIVFPSLQHLDIMAIGASTGLWDGLSCLDFSSLHSISTETRAFVVVGEERDFCPLI